MLVYIGGEDFVTKQIAKRLVRHCMIQGELEFEDLTFRDHGTKALERINLMLNLAMTCPVVGVFDSDNNCIVELIKKYNIKKDKQDFLAINFAIDEAEAWLLADRDNFSRYFGISEELIPARKETETEISKSIAYKTSLFIVNEIAPLANSEEIKRLLCSERPGKKPATYNAVWGKFIDTMWDINAACENSESLSRAVKRVDKMIRNVINGL